MPAEAGHHIGRPYHDQATGALHMNGALMTDAADNTVDLAVISATDLGTNGLQREGMCRVLYDFAVDGGAISAIVPATAVSLPAKAVVTAAFAQVLTAFTGGAGATIALSIEGANDIRTAATIVTGGFDTTGMKALIPVGTAATAVVTTVARKLTLTVAVNALTAGKAVFILYYFVGG